MSSCKRFITMLSLVLYFIPCGVNANNDQSAHEYFFEANRAYKNSQFQTAVDGYLELLKTEMKTVIFSTISEMPIIALEILVERYRFLKDPVCYFPETMTSCLILPMPEIRPLMPSTTLRLFR